MSLLFSTLLFSDDDDPILLLHHSFHRVYFLFTFLLDEGIDISTEEASLVSQPRLKCVLRLLQIFSKQLRIIVMCFSETSFTEISLIFVAHSIICSHMASALSVRYILLFRLSDLSACLTTSPSFSILSIIGIIVAASSSSLLAISFWVIPSWIDNITNIFH